MKNKANGKIAHLLSEINLYLLEKDADKIVNEIVELEDKTTITVCGKVQISTDELERLQEMVTAHHEYEYDEYWLLVGDGVHCDELPLLGSLIDLGEVSYNDDTLKIYIERNKI